MWRMPIGRRISGMPIRTRQLASYLIFIHMTALACYRIISASDYTKFYGALGTLTFVTSKRETDLLQLILCCESEQILALIAGVTNGARHVHLYSRNGRRWFFLAHDVFLIIPGEQCKQVTSTLHNFVWIIFTGRYTKNLYITYKQRVHKV